MKITRDMYSGKTDVYTDLLDILLRSLNAHPYGGMDLELLLRGRQQGGAVSLHQAILDYREQCEHVLEMAFHHLEVTHG